jgi:hypothetical protein
MPEAGVDALIAFMQDFAQRHQYWTTFMMVSCWFYSHLHSPPLEGWQA